MVWNFPASRNGRVKIVCRIEGEGFRLTLADHWMNPCDEFGPPRSPLSEPVAAADVPRGVWWNHGTLAEELHRNAAHPFDVRFTIEISAYGEPHVELRLVDLRVQD